MNRRSFVSLVCCFSFVAVLFTSAAIASDLGGGPRLSSADVVPVAVSEDMSYVLITSPFKKGLKLVNTASGQITVISKQANAAQYASVSADGKYVCYKGFEKTAGEPLQVPMLYDIAAGKSIALCAPMAQAGTPTVAANGTIAYTAGNDLVLLDASLKAVKTISIGNHVNLLSLNADASKVALNNADDQLFVIDVATGAKKKATDAKSYWGPQFSPKGDKVLANAVDGRIVVSNAKGVAKVIGAGENAAWVDNDTVAFAKKTVKGQKVEKTEVVAVGVGGKKKAVLLSEAGDVTAVVAKTAIAVAKGAKLQYGYAKDGKAAKLIDLQVPVVPETSKDDQLAGATAVDSGIGARNFVDAGTYTYLSNVPYIHQNNDTPDYWNGNSSCGATSALMAINYFNIMAKHPITCSWPSVHTSDYGWYIPSNYSFNGHTFNIGSADPNGTIGYGGFGWITQGGWEDTKGHMAEYISYHGPTSGVDWSPSMAKARTEVAANKPFVLLSSITAAGHYKCTMGAYKTQNTLIFNDPYGNKNSGSYPSNDGRSVRYDWPGYNNGYNNLVTVHCYIWCRFGQPGAATNLGATAVSSTQINLSWTDNSYCEANYEVWRSTTSGSGYAKIATLGANVTSYNNTGLAANTTYYYVVKACNGSGCSPNSNEAQATTQAGIADIIVDNNQAGFTASANWSTGTSAADKYGADYRFRTTAAISDLATWSFSIPSTRNYETYAWWSVGTNRAVSATYTLPDGSTKAVNQQANGGKWNSLGIKSVTAGTKNVKLSCWTTTGYVVVADAVKIVAR